MDGKRYMILCFTELNGYMAAWINEGSWLIVCVGDWSGVGVLTGGPGQEDVLHRLEVEEVLEIVDDAGGGG
jgi:hypothetical protein